MASRITLAFAPTAGFAPRSALLRAWAAASMMLQARSTRRMLAEMEPRMLADIGASRSDAQMEAARPFWDVASRRRA